MSRAILIYGASGHGKVVAEAARSADFEVLGWGDDDASKAGRELHGYRVLASGVEAAAALAGRHSCGVVVAIGDNRVRRRIADMLEARGVQLVTVIHSSATISPSASIGRGTVVFAQVVVNASAKVGANVILNTSATVDHDCVIADAVHVSPGVHLGGCVEIGEGAHVGIGSCVSNNLSIGRWSIVGAGAVVVRNVAAAVVAYGVPARAQRSLEA